MTIRITQDKTTEPPDGMLEFVRAVTTAGLTPEDGCEIYAAIQDMLRSLNTNTGH